MGCGASSSAKAAAATSHVSGETAPLLASPRILSPTLPDDVDHALHVRVVAAHNVQPRDPTKLPDPYVLLRLGRAKHKTRTAKKSLHPRWDAYFVFENAVMQDSLVVEVWDKGVIGMDGPLGIFEVPLCTLNDGRPKECRYPLEPRKSEHVSGDVHLVLQVKPKDSEHSLTPRGERDLKPLVHLGSGQLSVGVLELKETEASGCHVVIWVDTQFSRVVLDAGTRDREENLFYFEANEQSVVRFALMLETEQLAEASFPVKDLLVLREAKDDWLPLKPSQQKTKCGSIRVSLQFAPSSAIPVTQIMFSDFFTLMKDGWASRPLERHLWAESCEHYDLLVDQQSAKAHGYMIESGPNCVLQYQTSIPEEPVFDIMLTFPYYAQYLYGTCHEIHYGSHHSVGPVVVLVGSPELSGIRRVMVITKKEEKRFVVPNIKGYLRAVRSAYPVLMSVKLVATQSATFQDALVQFERGQICRKHKFGVLYAKTGQREELSLFGNTDASEAFDEFTQLIGDKIVLMDWKYFRGGLDNKANQTGESSVYTTYGDIEVMFHVSTMLPYTANDSQFVDRKRHIGNDVAVVIFKERASADDTVDVCSFLSNFNHVFVVVSPEEREGAVAHYRVNVVTKPGVDPVPPFLPEDALIPKTDIREWLLPKLISMERSALQASQFMAGRMRTRKQLLDDIIGNGNCK
eukprot:m51a1_g4947 hypothetical protein (688) ;mRNA; f:324931-328005